MKELKGACIIGQSGGPTSVINASAYGVIDTALKSGVITQVLGVFLNGVQLHLQRLYAVRHRVQIRHGAHGGIAAVGRR